MSTKAARSSTAPSAEAVRPPLPTPQQWRTWGVDPAWSRLVEARGNTWHVLDTGSPTPGTRRPPTTIICVHGNPTWSFLWRSFHSRLGDRYRVVAVDQLGMGYSDRTGSRCFAQRVDDLGDVIDALQIDGPVITAGHDWGGPISLGWALRNQARLLGVILCNTGVAVPAGRHAPALIRLAAAGPMTDFVGRRTRLFVDGTVALSGKRISSLARSGFRAPYRHARFRQAVADFVADVPFDEADVSAAAIADVAEGIRHLTVPVLLAWGSKDPVFNDDFAMDLAERMPHADRHRFRGLGHLVVEETDIATMVDDWIDDRILAPVSGTAAVAESTLAPTGIANVAARPIWTGITDRAGDETVAFVDIAARNTTTFAELHHRVAGIAGGLIAIGVQPGDRVAVLVPPGVDLLATVYGCWRAGAVTVIADRGLGLRGLGGAVRAAHVSWVIGAPKAIAAARLLRWAPGARHIVAGRSKMPGAVSSLDRLVASGAPLPPEPLGDDAAAVLYTSGATGPAKGVRYTHAQIAAQRDAVRATYAITRQDRLVAAFAPFALYGPALGITSTIPDVDVTAPGSLTAAALATAIDAVRATIVFASPAALANVDATAGGHTFDSLRLVLSAGAPVPIATLRAMAKLCPAAELHTPYGMTECLPVADIDLRERETATDEAGAEFGVCVGRPVGGVDVMIAPLGFDPGAPINQVDSSTMGEVLVRAPWLSDGYDQLWITQHAARPHSADGGTWHRTGDVGRIDSNGRLWIEGRNVHVIHTANGPVTPVPVEVAVESLGGIRRAAAAGVGPAGCQQLVVVIEQVDAADGLADSELTATVRRVVEHDVGGSTVAAVLIVNALPVDIRHNTKIDRTLVSEWATGVLAGDRVRRPW